MLDWFPNANTPFVMAGPTQFGAEGDLLKLAQVLKENLPNVQVFHARSRRGETEISTLTKKHISSLLSIKKELGLKLAVEVNTSNDVDLCLSHGVDILWIGSTVTMSQLLTRELASVVGSVDVPLLIENPTHADFKLWFAAINTFGDAGSSKVAALHRGFSTYQGLKYKNDAGWRVPIELRRVLPSLPIICDPSHIAGKKEYVFDAAQRALDLGLDGLMFDLDPGLLSPLDLKEAFKTLRVKTPGSEEVTYNRAIEELRSNIDQIDRQLVEGLSQRHKIVEKIGRLKLEKSVAVLQPDRWHEMLDQRMKMAETMGLQPKYIKDIFEIIHTAAVRVQALIKR